MGVPRRPSAHRAQSTAGPWKTRPRSAYARTALHTRPTDPPSASCPARESSSMITYLRAEGWEAVCKGGIQRDVLRAEECAEAQAPWRPCPDRLEEGGDRSLGPGDGRIRTAEESVGMGIAGCWGITLWPAAHRCRPACLNSPVSRGLRPLHSWSPDPCPHLTLTSTHPITDRAPSTSAPPRPRPPLPIPPPLMARPSLAQAPSIPPAPFPPLAHAPPRPALPLCSWAAHPNP